MTDTKCKDRVADAAESRLSTISAMMNPQAGDFSIADDGTLDTVIAWNHDTGFSWRFDQESAAEYRDDSGELDIEALLNDNNDIYEELREAFHEYGLSFEWVDGNAENPGYWRYLLSYGGPSEEIRFYGDAARNVYKIEFWLLDWFDGAPRDITQGARAQALAEDFAECGMFSHNP